MSSDKAIKRIEQLIALSTSDQIEEARNAAHKACQMIREGKFRIVEGNGSPIGSTPPRNTPPWAASPKSPIEDLSDLFRDMARKADPSQVRRGDNPIWDEIFRTQYPSESTFSKNPFPKDPHVGHSVGHSVGYEDPEPQDPRVVVNPGIHGTNEIFRPVTSTARCDGKCERLIEKGEEAWHSRWYIRCIRCGPKWGDRHRKAK